MSSARATNGKLSVVPNADSYFYESFACQTALSNGYNAITFPVKGPAGGSLTLEIQTKGACSADAYQSHFYTVSDLTGTTQTITVPLASFSGANSNAITSFVWSGFSGLSAIWEFGKIQFVCSTSSGSTSGPSGVISRISSSSIVSSKAPAPIGQCRNLLIDDWASQSRLTFLYYNAMLNPSSDDGTMESVLVDSTKNRVTYSPKDSSSYFYTQLGCTDTKNRFGGST
ncbi:polysaccharide deacetylase, partial [Aureobasidium melanogenum]